MQMSLLVKKIVNWRIFFAPYPRKVGHWDGGASLYLVWVMFRPLSYCHVPSILGNWQLEQGHISFIGSFFCKSVFFLLPTCAGIYLMSTWVFSPSSLSTSTYCVKGSFRLYFGVLKSHNCSLAVAIYDNIFDFDFGEYYVGCCSSHCKTSAWNTVALLPRWMASSAMSLWLLLISTPVPVLLSSSLEPSVWQLMLWLIGYTSL